MIDLLSLMEDRDVKEMFLNFQLHVDAICYTGIDIGDPLYLTLRNVPFAGCAGIGT